MDMADINLELKVLKMKIKKSRRTKEIAKHPVFVFNERICVMCDEENWCMRIVVKVKNKKIQRSVCINCILEGINQLKS